MYVKMRLLDTNFKKRFKLKYKLRLVYFFDTQNDLQALQNHLLESPGLYHSVSCVLHFDLRLLYLFLFAFFVLTNQKSKYM